MRYVAFATDYDGTLAEHGRVSGDVLAALEDLARSGRKLLLVTGRVLPDLLDVFPQLEIFDRVVAENGALVYRPADRQETLLTEPPPSEFIAELERRGVAPLSVGQGIVATWEPHETVVLEVIRDLGLGLHVIFNKGAVMVLPASVTKASGLAAALNDLQLSPHNVVGIGDAQNDHAFLELCECSVAVANALPSLKERADLTMATDHGNGVLELARRLLDNDLADVQSQRRLVPLARGQHGGEVMLPPYGVNLLVAGTSGGGKSTAATGLLERLAAQGYQICVIDPEGDYEAFDPALVLGTSDRAPGIDECLEALQKPETSCVVNLVALPFSDRPSYFAALLSRLQDLRSRTGRPHWLAIDEAHHVLPADWEPAPTALPSLLESTLMITVHPELMATAALEAVDAVIGVGDTAQDVLAAFAAARNHDFPKGPAEQLGPGQVLYWNLDTDRKPELVEVIPPAGTRKRHKRKYAEGDLGEDRSFYFRGPDKKLNLQANNLMLFLQLAAGVDDDTWLHHLQRGDYTTWFREVIKDEDLAEAARSIEQESGLSAAESRERIAAEVEQRYTLAA